MLEFSESVSRIAVNFIGVSAFRISLAGVYRKSLADRIPDPLFKRFLSPPGLRVDKLRKLHENLFYAIWHFVSFVLVLSTLLRREWFLRYIESWDPGHAYYGFPHTITEDEESLYLFEFGFWFSCLGFLTVETIRKDAAEMALHHLATIALIGLSHLHGYHRFGFLIMALHDVGDIFLYSAKFFNYLGWGAVTNAFFGIFVLVFFISRLVIFPSLIWMTLGPLLGHFNEIDWRTQSGTISLPCLLLILLVLHVMWFGLIVRMVINILKTEKKQVEHDIRSDDEGTSPELLASNGTKSKKKM